MWIIKREERMIIEKLENFESPKSCVLLVGPPGSGKGTQASILESKSGYKHISTGEILRSSKSSKIKKMMKTGELLPDSLVSRELKKYLRKNMDVPGFIFDGYPRNPKQKFYFDDILKECNLKLDHIFFLNVPEKVMKERIKERSRTSGRSDDNNPEALNRRLKEYKTQTLPMIESMRKNPNFIEIKGEGSVSDITNIIFENIPEI